MPAHIFHALDRAFCAAWAVEAPAAPTADGRRRRRQCRLLRELGTFVVASDVASSQLWPTRAVSILALGALYLTLGAFAGASLAGGSLGSSFADAVLAAASLVGWFLEGLGLVFSSLAALPRGCLTLAELPLGLVEVAETAETAEAAETAERLERLSPRLERRDFIRAEPAAGLAAGA
ncbi:LPS export ABC transporter permease LptF [Babesia caballi]|uniref:LPS export ABC transporter permease LptF n=1 Tax=Babesia caballi TaxID=5871 RepID=A0AAV4LZ07_BABCB|nr:LPS export ABC transporter permease LptF [Babesia caballi]